MFGISKQAYYQRIEADKQQEKVHQIVLDEESVIRKKKPQTGTRKLMEELHPALGKTTLKWAEMPSSTCCDTKDCW